MSNALKKRQDPIGGQTIAEGIAVKNVGAKTVAICGALLDDVLLVSEDMIERAIAMLLSIEKTVVEGAGAAGGPQVTCSLQAHKQNPNQAQCFIRREHHQASTNLILVRGHPCPNRFAPYAVGYASGGSVFSRYTKLSTKLLNT